MPKQPSDVLREAKRLHEQNPQWSESHWVKVALREVDDSKLANQVQVIFGRAKQGAIDRAIALAEESERT